MKRYDSYKDSGIEWIGEVPSHWDDTRIKFTVNEKHSLFIDGDWIESKVITEEGIRYITTGNVKVGYYSEQGNGYISSQTFNDLNCTEVYEGDLIISRLNNPIGRACIIPNLNSRIVTSVDNVIYRPDSNLNKRYLLYLFSSKEYFEHTDLISRGATMQRISRGMLGNLKIPRPCIVEQTTIANYLDQKTTQIDDLIAKKERLIQLLEEECTAIINQAVTKGLDPSVPMKDSGIEWLGEIPAHWVVKMLKFVTSLITNGFVGPTRDLYYETGVRYIQSLHIKKGKIDFERSPYYVSEEWSNDHPRSILKEGDVLVVQTGAVGEVAMVDKDYEDCNCHALIIVRTNEKLIPVFLLNLLESSFGKAQMKLIETGALHQHINSTKLKDIITIVPPIEEQSQIVRFIEEQRGRIQTVINKTQQEIELLKEYKTALISEVVTGKVDVRDGK
jgi:type I restriction enzyme S subunit